MFAQSTDECDEGSLMQAFSRLAVPSPGNASKNNTSAQLLASMKTMASTVTKLQTGTGIDDETMAGFAAAIDAASAVLDEAFPMLTREHEQSESRIDVARAAVASCLSSPVTGGQVVSGFNTLVQDRRATHSACRVTQNTLSAVKTTACDDFNDFMQFVPEASCGVSRDSAQAMGSMFDELHRYVEDHRSTFQEKRAACEAAEAGFEEHQCIVQQSEFEQALCSRKTACTVLDDCWDRQKMEFDNLIDFEVEAMVLRQNQYITLHHSQCLLQLIQSAFESSTRLTTEDLQQCDEVPNTDSLAVSVPDLETPTACAEARTSAEVCSSEFFEAEYGEFPQWQEMASTCIACAGPGVGAGAGAGAGSGADASVCPDSDITGDWTLTVGGANSAHPQTDVGRECFNELFRACPVVRYTHADTRGNSVYVRHGEAYTGDAYDLFTHFWVRADNEFHVDFDIYGTIENARADEDKWESCSFSDDPNPPHVGVGYPRDCTPRPDMTSFWYPSGGPSPTGRGFFEVYTGQDCPGSTP